MKTVAPKFEAPGFFAALEETKKRKREIEQYSSGLNPSCEGYVFFSWTPATFCRSAEISVLARAMKASRTGAVNSVTFDLLKSTDHFS